MAVSGSKLGKGLLSAARVKLGQVWSGDDGVMGSESPGGTKQRERVQRRQGQTEQAHGLAPFILTGLYIGQSYPHSPDADTEAQRLLTLQIHPAGKWTWQDRSGLFPLTTPASRNGLRGVRAAQGGWSQLSSVAHLKLARRLIPGRVAAGWRACGSSVFLVILSQGGKRRSHRGWHRPCDELMSLK